METLDFAWGVPSKGENSSDPWGKANAENTGNRKEEKKECECWVYELAPFPLVSMFEILGKNRDKGNSQRSLPKQPSQRVGNSEGDEKSIRFQTCAEKIGDHHVSKIAENPTEQCSCPNNPRGCSYFFLFRHLYLFSEKTGVDSPDSLLNTLTSLNQRW